MRQLLFSFFLLVVWWLSWNFVRFNEILFQTDDESYSFKSWKIKKVLFEKKYFLMSKSLDTRGNCLTQVLGNWFSQLNNCHYTANIRGCRFQLCIFPKSFRMNMNLKLENISKSFYFCLGTKFSIRTGKAEHGVHRVHMHPHILPGKAA